MKHEPWNNPVGPADNAGQAASGDVAESVDRMRLAIWSLVGATVFLVALIGVVLLARQLRPVVHGGNETGEETVATSIAQLRQATDAAKRRAAAEYIVAQGPAAVVEALDGLVTIVGDNDSLTFSPAAIHALAATGAAAAPLFAQALSEKKDNVRAGAAYVLREMGPAAGGVEGTSAADPRVIQALIDALGSSNHWTRWYVIETLGNLGPRGAPAVEALAGLVSHRDAQTRLRAVRTLGRIGTAAQPAAAALTTARDEDRDQAVRRAAAETLLDVNLPGLTAAARARANETVRELIDKLLAANEFESPTAARRLGEMGNAAGDAVPALAQALESPQKWVRAGAAEALGALSAAGADVQMVVPRLQKVARDADPEVRAAAEKSLKRIRPGGNP